MSVLFAMAPDAAIALSRIGHLPQECVSEMISSEENRGECFVHLDLNDPGMGHARYAHVPWGSAQVDACPGLAYVHGHEGLEGEGGARRHVGEELWHLVMVISCRCSERERQAICGWEEGDATCLFEFPHEDPALPDDEVRVHVYGVDYSRRPHGNPMMGAPMPRGAWCMRFTPYGTTHVATWASIIDHVSQTDPERGRRLRFPQGVSRPRRA